MGFMDIRPYRGPLGGHTTIIHARLPAGQLFFKGEPVRINNAGDVVECTDGAVLATNGTAALGIAAAGPGDGGATDFYDNTNPATGLAYADGNTIPVYLVTLDALWITQNVSLNGTTFAVATATYNGDVGQPLELRNIGGTWGIESDSSGGLSVNANTGRILDLLDAQLVSVAVSGGTPAWAVFSLLPALIATTELPDAAA